MNDSGEIRTSVSGAVAHVRLSRTAKLNSLSSQMWEAIPAAMAELARTPGVRLVALRGDGGTFSTGADLGDVLDATGSAEATARYCDLVGRALLAVARAPVPIVALVEGAAVGGGAELALAADIRVMAPTAQFALPLARLGVVPDRLTTRRLLALAGPGTARLLLLGGTFLPGRECLDRGLADRLAEPELFDSMAHEIASALTPTASSAVAAIKAALAAEEGLDRLGERDGVEDLTARMRESFLDGELRRKAAEFLCD